MSGDPIRCASWSECQLANMEENQAMIEAIREENAAALTDLKKELKDEVQAVWQAINATNAVVRDLAVANGTLAGKFVGYSVAGSFLAAALVFVATKAFQ